MSRGSAAHLVLLCGTASWSIVSTIETLSLRSSLIFINVPIQNNSLLLVRYHFFAGKKLLIPLCLTTQTREDTSFPLPFPFPFPFPLLPFPIDFLPLNAGGGGSSFRVRFFRGYLSVEHKEQTNPSGSLFEYLFAKRFESSSSRISGVTKGAGKKEGKNKKDR